MRPLQFHRSIWAALALGALGFLAFRLAQLLRYGDTALIAGHGADLARAFWMGARFDLKALSVMLLLFLGPACLLAMPALTRRVGARLQRGAVAAIFFVVNFSAACQYFYYGFYKTPFSPIVFGLFEDDTVGVLVSIWSDFPVVTASLGVIALTAFQSWLVFRFASPGSAAKRPWAKRLAIAIPTVLILALLARGTLSNFPLHDQDATVSADPFINDLVRNSLQTLYDSSKDRRAQVTIGANPAIRLPAYGFASLAELGHALGSTAGTPHDLEGSIFRRTPRNPKLAANPPHVVFALMESWGAHALKFDSPENNLTGAMGRHLKRGFLFRNFFPSQNGTHPTLEALLLNSPLTPLTQGQYGLISFSAAALRPFKEQGYRTVFVYGGSNAWRSLGRALKHQYFDETYDIGDILARYPDAERTIWGVYDEYLFGFVHDLLLKADAEGQKIFVFLMTTTNHPPHSVPSTYRPLPIDPDSMRAYFAKDMENSVKQVQTYQYATHQLGLFIDGVESGPLGRKTIVVATGDHNLRTLLQYHLPSDAKDQYRVPGYFYVPKAYLPATPPDLDRYSGHRDIFPTLYGLALSDAVYPAYGENLFAPLPEKKQFAMVSYQLLFSRQGALLPYLGKPSAFRWDDKQSSLVQADSAPETLLEQGKQARALTALADWYTRYQVTARRATRP
jgi:hypothetical protein